MNKFNIKRILIKDQKDNYYRICGISNPKDYTGEYYLKIDEGRKLRVLVLDRGDEISSNVLRVFDFLTANLVVTQGNDKAFYENSGKFAMDFFSSGEPKMLLCGPTLGFFAMILRDRFNIPVRDVTFTGVLMDGGKVLYSTHNVLEVFLPDKNKWMLFDINNGFAVKWMDAFELTETIRAASSSKTNINKTENQSINLDLHYLVDARRAVNPSDSTPVFRPEILKEVSVRDSWIELFRIYLGGPGYWGGKRFSQQGGLSPEYQLYESLYHQDQFLLEAQVRWVGNWNLKVRQVPPEELKQMLEDAYAEDIATAKWLDYLPRPIPDAYSY